MENFVVSALKYRPQQFADVVGQSAITQTLENAIAKNQLPQALLFCGPRGVGKTTCARILAKKIKNLHRLPLFWTSKTHWIESAIFRFCIKSIFFLRYDI